MTKSQQNDWLTGSMKSQNKINQANLRIFFYTTCFWMAAM